MSRCPVKAIAICSGTPGLVVRPLRKPSIVTQLHFRYDLGFIPTAIDGKRHELKVELTKEAKKKHGGVRVICRTEYIPVAEAPNWTR